MLADHFLFQINCKLGSTLQRLSAEALNKLMDHDWPGNVRELKNVIERAAILCDTAEVGGESILFSFDLASPATGLANPKRGPSTGQSLSDQLDTLERQIVAHALKSARSIRQAATILGVSHTTLRNKIKKHRL